MGKDNKSKKYRITSDSMGEMKVPSSALYGAQTQRAVDNFPISGIKFNYDFISAVVIIKRSAAIVNLNLKLINKVSISVSLITSLFSLDLDEISLSLIALLINLKALILSCSLFFIAFL